MNPPTLARPDILRILRQLGPLARECCLTSGAALVLYGVKERTRDVDLICDTDTAQRLLAEGYSFHDSPLGGRVFTISDLVEVLEGWPMDDTVALGEYRLSSLESIRRQKTALGREKDFVDIRLIDRFLEKRAAPIRLETPRLVLRDYTPADEEDYFLLKSHPRTMYYLQDIMVHSREEAREDFARVLADAARPDRTFYFLRAEEKGTGRQIGSVGYTVVEVNPMGKHVGAGYFYLPEFWGQGFGTEALARVLRFAFEENGVYRVSTGCLAENRGSERVMQKCGMILEAVRPSWTWHDGQLKERREYCMVNAPGPGTALDQAVEHIPAEMLRLEDY